MANVTFESDILIQGSLLAHENSTAEATHDATPRDIVAAWDATQNGSANNVTQDDTNGKLIVTKAGFVAVHVGGLATCTVNKTFEVGIAVNGTLINAESHGTITATITEQAFALHWEGEVSANDEITVQQWSADGGSAFTSEYLQFVIQGFASSGA